MTTTHTTLANPLSHPEDPHAVLGALDYWTSDTARAEYTDAERLAAVDAVMAQHQAARDGAVRAPRWVDEQYGCAASGSPAGRT